MKKKKEKGYWEKRTERFPVMASAKSRAVELRGHEHTAHVKVDKISQAEYSVSYSVAKWYLTALQEAGVKL